jgi:hypothetical protein
MQHAYSQNNIEYIERIYKEKEYYYMFVKPTQTKDKWYNLFTRFDPKDVLNTGHANCISTRTVETGRIWQILNDTLFYLTVAPGDIHRPKLTPYNQYPLDTVFKIIITDDKVMDMATRFGGLSIHSHIYWYQADKFNQIVKLHTWSDIVHTKDEYTIFASISDTVLMIKDIPPTYSPTNRSYTIREYTYTFPHLGRFNVFKINDGYFVLNDIGDFYHLQDSMPRMIGHLEFQTVNQVFYLKDNDTGTLSFNCMFVPLFPEYDKLIGYIGPEHWLYTRYFTIKEEYMEELHELNRKTWR